MEAIVGFVKGNLNFQAADRCDDFVDRLHHHITTGLLTLFAIASSIYLYFGSPLQCFVPPHYPGGWEQYAEEYCFVEHTYYIPADKPIPRNIADRQPKIFYYQWVPFFMALQALCFYLPYGFIWKSLSSSAGIDVSSILSIAHADNQLGETKTLAAILSSRSTFAEDRRANGTSRLAIVPSKSNQAYLALLYLVVKLLYIVNVVGQMVIVNLMLGAPLSQYPLFGFQLLVDHLQNRDWWFTGLFPRIVYCDADIRVLANTQRHTYQCVLQVNMYYEKIYLSLWLWLFILAVVTVCNLVNWVCLLLPAKRNAFVLGLLRDARLATHAFNSDPQPVNRDTAMYVGDTFLGVDGVFLLYLIERNANRREAANVLNEIYKDFEKRKKRAARQPPSPPALPRYARNAPSIEEAEIGYADAELSKP